MRVGAGCFLAGGWDEEAGCGAVVPLCSDAVAWLDAVGALPAWTALPCFCAAGF